MNIAEENGRKIRVRTSDLAVMEYLRHTLIDLKADNPRGYLDLVSRLKTPGNSGFSFVYPDHGWKHIPKAELREAIKHDSSWSVHLPEMVAAVGHE